MKLNKRIHYILAILLIGSISANSAVIPAKAASPTSPLFSAQFSHANTETLATLLVPSGGDLQQAIEQVEDGGVIEIASGAYNAPQGGFQIKNQTKSFTIQPVAGQEVTLSGGGATNILVVSNTSIDAGGSVVFKGLTFDNGVSSTDTIGGAVSIKTAKATFIDCVFSDNLKRNSNPQREGGALFINQFSTVFIFDSIFMENQSVNGGAAIGVRDSALYIHNTQFIDNHALSADQVTQPVGGAIYNANSVLRISSSSFLRNTSSGHGGAIYGIGTWTTSDPNPRADILVVNTVFEKNQALHHSNPKFAVAEGGAINIEDQTLLRIYQSRFTLNSGMIGGGINIFRSKAEIYSSVFQGNRATDTNPISGFGGAIRFHYYDRPDYASIRVEDTLIQGRYDTVTSNAMYGGGIAVGGNRAAIHPAVTLSRVVLNDCDVTTDGTSKSAMAGALSLSGVDIHLTDSMVMNSDALSPAGGTGGGILAYPYTILNISDSVIANNSADTFGGGIFVQSSDFRMSNSIVVDNALDPTANNNDNRLAGAALNANIDSNTGVGVTGLIQDSIFSNNLGVPVSEDDRDNGPNNELQYNGNRFYNTTFGNIIYWNSLAIKKTVGDLNQLVINRQNGSSTRKSPMGNNEELSQAYTFGKLLSVPSTVLSQAVAGFPKAAIQPFLAYSWNGKNAALNGAGLADHHGVADASGDGVYILSVDGTNSSSELLQGTNPAATLQRTRLDGNYIRLDWQIDSDSFLDMAIDNGATLTPAGNGSVVIAAPKDYDYHLYAITKEGGVVTSANSLPPTLHVSDEIFVMTGLNRPPVNLFNQLLANKGSGQIAWNASTSGVPAFLNLSVTSGAFDDKSSLQYTIDVTDLLPGEYTNYIDIDAGEAGASQVMVNIQVVDELTINFIPVIPNR